MFTSIDEEKHECSNVNETMCVWILHSTYELYFSIHIVIEQTKVVTGRYISIKKASLTIHVVAAEQSMLGGQKCVYKAEP